MQFEKEGSVLVNLLTFAIPRSNAKNNGFCYSMIKNGIAVKRHQVELCGDKKCALNIHWAAVRERRRLVFVFKVSS